jgi:ATP-dependent RNA helicase RhlE
MASPIQEESIPRILGGKDIFAQAETGSGKTGAFAIPILHQVLEQDSNEKLYLILSPTRELAQQTFSIFEKLGNDLGVKCVNVIGGESIQKQKDRLQKEAQVIIGTPGRVMDLMKQRIIDGRKIKSITFDEADRLFDMGFKSEIEFVLSRSDKNRQLIMLSATSNMDVLKTAYKFKSHPEEINLSEDSLLVDHIDHKLAMVSREEKFPFLVNLLRKKEDVYAIVFCNTQLHTHKVGEWLKKMNFKAASISGRLAQNKRTKLMDDFRDKKTTILVCTDVAARGLDIKAVDLVVNYDLPNDAANYVHRIGRTGRAGESGEAISLCAYEDCDYMDPIEEMIESKIPKMELTDDDFATDICAAPRIDEKTLKENTPERKSNNAKKERKMRTQTSNKESKKPQFQNKRNDKKSKDNRRSDKKDRKKKSIFTYTTKSFDEAQRKAARYLNTTIESLEYSITKKGAKKFLFFGSQEVTYEFKRGAQMETKIKVYLDNLFEKAGLSLELDSEYNSNGELNIIITGEDIGLVLTNKKQLLFAFDTVLQQFLIKRMQLPKGVRLNIEARGDNPKPEYEKQDRPRRERSERGDRPRRDNRGGKGRRDKPWTKKRQRAN